MKNKFLLLGLATAFIITSVVSFPAVSNAAALTAEQINAITNLLQSFGADQNAIVNVKNVLSGGSGISVPSSPETSSPQPSTPVPVTDDCASSVISSSRMGSSGSQVSVIQNFLIKEGYDIPAVSSGTVPAGYYGNQTRDAVIKYQKSEGLTSTGVVDSPTLEKINSETRTSADCVPPLPPPPNPNTISEQVKCVFNGATTEQKCTGVGQYTTTSNGMEKYPPQFYCSGIGSCVMKVSGPKGMNVQWNSSCSGSANTTIDGNDEYASFSCVETKASITVLSPNGGESWSKGTMQTIKWQDNTPFPKCPEGAYCMPPAPKLYDIKLMPYQTPCPIGFACPAYSPAPYTIAKSVTGPTYDWKVGSIPNLYDALAGDGSYTIQVCQSGTNTCDSSDSYFKITSSSSTNSSPKITGFPAIPSNIQPGQAVNISLSATDPDNDDLSWSVDWGEGIGEISSCSVGGKTGTGWSFNKSHSWAQAGTYQVKVTVSDCRGGSDSYTFSVTVGNSTNPSITVLSPNGGETYRIENGGNTITVNWKTNNVLSSKIIDVIRLRSYQNGQEYVLATNVLNDGQEIVVLPTSVPAGAYTLEMKTYVGDILVMDSSDSYFKITDVSQSSISYSVKTDKQSYMQDEIINIKITATNSGSEPVTLNFNSGCQVWYSVASYDSSSGQVCSLALTAATIPAYGNKSWTLTHSPEQYKIPVGSYKLSGKVIGYAEATTPITITSPVTQPSITVLSPNGGETWIKGGSNTVSWKSQGLQQVAIIIQKVNSDTSYSFGPFPANGSTVLNDSFVALSNGSDYRVRIVDWGYGGIYSDQSDSYFTITSPDIKPSITVLSPNGGEVWLWGSSQQISWQNQSTSAVDVYYVSATTGSEYTTIKNLSGQNSLAVNAGLLYIGADGSSVYLPLDSYKVKACLAGTSQCDISDSYFKIVSSEKTTTSPTSYSGNNMTANMLDALKLINPIYR
ncbi:MAG TPA: peptidoglycan-binding protein [Candidatus Paceibacterota bacterium]